MANPAEPGAGSWLAVGDQALAPGDEFVKYASSECAAGVGIQQRLAHLGAWAALSRLLPRFRAVDRLCLGSAWQRKNLDSWKLPHRLRSHQHIQLVFCDLSG